jgi:hypothetical protein
VSCLIDSRLFKKTCYFTLGTGCFNDSDFNYPISYKKDYKNIDDKVINEIMRVFGKNTVEVLDD